MGSQRKQASAITVKQNEESNCAREQDTRANNTSEKERWNDLEWHKGLPMIQNVPTLKSSESIARLLKGLQAKKKRTNLSA